MSEDVFERILSVPTFETRMWYTSTIPLSLLSLQLEEEIQLGLSRSAQAQKIAKLLCK